MDNEFGNILDTIAVDPIENLLGPVGSQTCNTDENDTNDIDEFISMQEFENQQMSMRNLSEEEFIKLESYATELHELQGYYQNFKDFYYDCSTQLLGYTPSRMQLNIAECMQFAPQYYMLMAQRGEAKTTIAGCFAVWLIIHNPKYRILIISAAGDLASDIMVWCTQIITMMPILACLNDNPTGTCRRSAEKFDVNLLLKGADKSASISCYGITSSLAGKRADFLLADDIESQKNSLTELMRERLNHLTLDFTSINRKGRIYYLGTPQSNDSIYNNLPSRGYKIDIFPGRIPTEKEREHFGIHLAKYVEDLYQKYPEKRDGYGEHFDRGAPTDPVMMSESDLVKKEIDQGPAYFNLQYMLDTTLLDADRYPLKPADLIFHDLDKEKAPTVLEWSNHPMYCLDIVPGQTPKQKYFRAATVGEEYMEYDVRLMAFDPAGGGQNGDETGVAVVFSAAGRLFAMEVTGIKGGSDSRAMKAALELVLKWKPNRIVVEKNFGYGAYAVALETAIINHNYQLEKSSKPAREKESEKIMCGVDEIYNTGQKEKRIADTLEPVIGNHKLVMNIACIRQNIQSTQKYEASKRQLYSLFHQMGYLTRDKGALMHEDRLEALQIAVAELMDHVKLIDEKETERIQRQKLIDMKHDKNSVWYYSHGGLGDPRAAKGQSGILSRLTNKLLKR